MAILVRIPTPLRQFTDDKKELTLEGVSVREVLGNLCAVYPDLRNQLFDQDGQIRKFVNLYLDDDDIRVLDVLDTPVTKNSQELAIIPAIAGGSSNRTV